ncbi:DNA-3-methyladenine glycosylase 2 family protein [Cellulomonas sp. NPDC089187]|uniref:DNA-3-methyladenine glycosylase family protein n=1 Tax=Cellulomonas sp. NPDC089187 TaxID=3154970 RepID=UPI003433DDB7
MPVTRTHRPDGPLDVRLTLLALRRGGGDPTLRIGAEGAVWRTVRTADGPATLHLTVRPGEVTGTAWGPGAERVIAGMPDLLGARDDPRAFDPAGHLGLHRAARAMPGLRLPRTEDLVGALVPAVLEQRVLTIDAHRAWRSLVLRHGSSAPGPAPEGMRVVPDAATWRDVPVWDWRRAGVDDARTRAIRRAMSVARALEQAVDLDSTAELTRRMCAVPGIGVWTAAEVCRRVLGDADAVSVGDLHLPRLVGTALGRRVAQDEVMDALSPWAPHRARVVRLLELVEHRTGRRDRPRPRRAARFG